MNGRRYTARAVNRKCLERKCSREDLPKIRRLIIKHFNLDGISFAEQKLAECLFEYLQQYNGFTAPPTNLFDFGEISKFDRGNIFKKVIHCIIRNLNIVEKKDKSKKFFFLR